MHTFSDTPAAVLSKTTPKIITKHDFTLHLGVCIRYKLQLLKMT